MLSIGAVLQLFQHFSRLFERISFSLLIFCTVDSNTLTIFLTKLDFLVYLIRLNIFIDQILLFRSNPFHYKMNFSLDEKDM